jgi:hypothetical protein
MEVKVFNLTDKAELQSITIEACPPDGEPIEINNEMYYVCETECDESGEIKSIGVIPLVAKDPGKIKDIKGYVNCLSIAHKRVSLRKNRK